LVLELWLAVQTAPGNSDVFGRDRLFALALGEMRARIRRLAGQLLPSMDLKDTGNNGRRAAAPFGLPDDPLPQKPLLIRQRIKQLLEASEELAGAIGRLEAPNAPSGAESSVLEVMRTADKPLLEALNAG